MAELLIVDDEPEIRGMLRKMLRQTNHAIGVAEDGATALSSFENNEYDLLIVDLRMPGMSGQALIEAIRQRDADVAVIVLTGHGDLNEAYRLLDQFRISDFLTKPLDNPTQLLFSVQNALERRLEIQRKKVEDLERTVKLAEATNLAKSEFLSTVGHEIQTPITSLKLALNILASGRAGELPDTAVEPLAVAVRNADRLRLLIKDLLDFQRLKAERLEFFPQAVELCELVQQTIADNRWYGQDRRIAFTLGKTAAGQVNVDPSRFKQILANFLSNAAKYSPDDGEVLIDVESRDEWFRVSVCDHGPGIPPEFTDKIFDKFTQADQSDTRQHSGTGLGLAISKDLTEHMNGQIGFETSVPNQTTFWVQFPVLET